MARQWTEEKDTMLTRQIAGSGLFEYKSGSRERGVRQVSKPCKKHKIKTAKEVKGS